MTTSRRLLALALAVAVCHVALPPFGAAAAGSRASAAKISEAQLDQVRPATGRRRAGRPACDRSPARNGASATARLTPRHAAQEDREFSFSADASDSFEPAAFKREREERLARADAFAGSRFAAAGASDARAARGALRRRPPRRAARHRA